VARLLPYRALNSGILTVGPTPVQRPEAMVAMLIQQRTIKEWYTTSEVAKMLGKAEFTVREWCRLKRIHAAKKECGRGTSSEWIIAHEAPHHLQRAKREGFTRATN